MRTDELDRWFVSATKTAHLAGQEVGDKSGYARAKKELQQCVLTCAYCRHYISGCQCGIIGKTRKHWFACELFERDKHPKKEPCIGAISLRFPKPKTICKKCGVDSLTTYRGACLACRTKVKKCRQ